MQIRGILEIYYLIGIVRSRGGFGGDDRFDKFMAKRDDEIDGLEKNVSNDNLVNPNHIEGMKKQEKLERQADAIRKMLKTKNAYPLTSKKLWDRLYQYIIDHIAEFLKNAQFSISFPIRYSFCVYVIPLIHINKTLIVPSVYKFLIPKDMAKLDIVKTFTKSFDEFMNVIKKRTKTEVLVTVRLKRQVTASEDLEIIKRMPYLVKNDPLELIRWLFDFKAEVVNSNILDEIKK